MKNSPWRCTALVALLLLPLLAYAEDSEHEMERAPCQSPQGLFSVVIRSPSGEPVEDDMTVWIEREGKPPWYELRVEKGRLLPRLSLSQTRERNGLGPFFKDDRAFAKALGFEPRKDALKVSGYKLALRADGSKCLALKKAGSTRDEPWRCVPPARP
ncbi:MAG TPA: hypothetical protein VK539_36005 [Myxococcaceae bacterium]|nr:hypothetical protein [Myxococcaceae bacterium]